MTERISRGELFSLLSLFLLGSAWLFGLASEAKEDAWLAILIGALAGQVLIAVYLGLQQSFPEQTLVEYLPRIIGKWLGKPLACLYLLYFLYIAARVVRDFAELTVTSILPNTPISVVVGVQLALVAYAVRHGLEVIARAGQVLFGLCVILVLLSTAMAAPAFRLENLRPVLGSGLQPVLQATFPLTVTVPFGESILFSMIWPHVASGRRWTTVGAAAAAGGILTYLAFFEVGVLGSHIVSTSQFPLLEMVRQIGITEFLERLDAIIVLVLTWGGFMKVSLFLYGATAGLARWLGLADYRPLVLPMAAIVAPCSLLIAGNYSEHIRIGLRWVPYVLHIPLQIVIPLLLLLIWWLRRLITPQKTGKAAAK